MDISVFFLYAALSCRYKILILNKTYNENYLNQTKNTYNLTMDISPYKI